VSSKSWWTRIVQQVGTRGTVSYRLAGGALSGRRRHIEASLAQNERLVLDALAAGEATRSELEHLTGLNADQVRYALNTLRQKGHVELRGKPRSPGARWAAVG
jgi:ATP-dependent DNA helicase RecG